MCVCVGFYHSKRRCIGILCFDPTIFYRQMYYYALYKRAIEPLIFNLTLLTAYEYMIYIYFHELCSFLKLISTIIFYTDGYIISGYTLQNFTPKQELHTIYCVKNIVNNYNSKNISLYHVISGLFFPPIIENGERGGFIYF